MAHQGSRFVHELQNPWPRRHLSRSVRSNMEKVRAIFSLKTHAQALGGALPFSGIRPRWRSERPLSEQDRRCTPLPVFLLEPSFFQKGSSISSLGASFHGPQPAWSSTRGQTSRVAGEPRGAEGLGLGPGGGPPSQNTHGARPDELLVLDRLPVLHNARWGGGERTQLPGH